MPNVAQLRFQYFGHVVRESAGVALCVLEGAFDGTTYQEALRTCWINNVLERSGKTYMELKAFAQDRITRRDCRWISRHQLSNFCHEDGTTTDIAVRYEQEAARNDARCQQKPLLCKTTDSWTKRLPGSNTGDQSQGTVCLSVWAQRAIDYRRHAQYPHTVDHPAEH